MSFAKRFFFITSLLLIATSTNASNHIIDIPPPHGFERVEARDKSFTAYLRSLGISTTKPILLWNGEKLDRDYYQSLALVDLPLLFDEDLEQCADWTMRFWAEYLKSINKLDALALYGFYGKPKPFKQSGKSFREYLRWHMQYSNSYSIKQGAKKINSLFDLESGDMFVQNRNDEGIGHVSMVLDEAQDGFGNKIYLIGYSFMPAQQFHIERASDNHGIDGWFTAEGYKAFASETFSLFGEPIIMRYQQYQR